MLKTDTLQALLDGRLAVPEYDAGGAQPGGKQESLTLRTSTKKFEHLKSQPKVVLRLLKNILPVQCAGGSNMFN